MSETYYLTHLRELSQSINHPLRQKRIKVGGNLIRSFAFLNFKIDKTIRTKLIIIPISQYSCFDVSDKFIVFGASSGSIYVFQRTGVFQRLIPSQLGVIYRISISHNEKQIAFANQKGAIGIVTDIENFNHEVAVTHLDGADNRQLCDRFLLD